MQNTRTPLLLLILTGCVPAAPGGQPATHLDENLGDESLSSEALVESFEDKDGWFVSPVNAAYEGGVRRVSVFLELEGEADVTVEARSVFVDGTVGAWTRLETSWQEAAMRVAFVDLDPASGAQIRIPDAQASRLSVLRWSATTPFVGEEEAAADDADLGASREPLLAELEGLDVVTRREWGARTTRCSAVDRTARYRMAIHHTSSPSTGDVAARVRGFQAYHMDSRGWCDVGYHFLIGRDGTIYEGRPLDLRGAHVGGHNSGNVGISLVGCFEPRNCSPASRWGSATPTDAMVASAARLVAVLAEHYDITRSARSILGHQQHSDQSTDCPGINVLDRMSEIRSGSTGVVETPPAPSAEGGSCMHSFGGSYASGACSSGYQCCEGAWRTRGASGCGSCVCVEETGRVGCDSAPIAPEPPPAASVPPPGASCVHSFGGAYANTACSTGYQCCDGAWRPRGDGACGGCFCVEETGTEGCGGSASEPPVGGGLHAGLTFGGSRIPRAGLSNATLRGALGVSVEPYGDVVDVDGVQWVSGLVSHFGGPSDRGVSSTETGAITGERLRDLNNPERPSQSTLRARPEDYYYVAMRWDYSPNGRTFWRDARLLVRNPATGARVVVRPVDWGPHTRTGRIVDLSPQATSDLGLTTDQDVHVAFAAPGTPLGVIAP